ncbi:plastid lipid associated protein [Ectocarpus siliculosus]|uniref:Plastid lipid associated protein n=1 Tax=Ectocarpus siliculosus TaxID=2880 RepID=D8LDC7_ECTSI|nr:plastid lipid associated protein [Ectocarpus siliculosus]|eukprot:CBN80185.1 plastid lipid associated protein [Ectocarpus siliculosus]
MTISAGKGLVGGCVLLYLGGTCAFVTPGSLAINHRLASPTAAAAGTPTTPIGATSQQRTVRRRRRRTPYAASSSPSMLDPTRSQAMVALPSRGVGPLLMTSGDGESGPGPAAVPVDAELSDPAAAGGGAGEGGGEDAVGDAATRAALKQKLLRKVATLNRGFVAEELDRLDVEEIIEMLEMENPNPKSCEGFETGSSPLAGRWQLLYTTSLDVLSLQINPAVTVGKIFQQIESDGRSIQNIIELQPPFAAVNKILGSSMTTLTVKLETEPVSDSRINLKFVRTEIKANSLFGRELDLPTLGVDIPSAERLEKLIPKGGGSSGGGKALKEKVEGAKTKARQLAEKLKGKKKKSDNAVDGDEKKKDDGEGNSSGDGDDVAEAADATPEAEEQSDKEEASPAPGDDEKASPAPGDGEESSPLASSLRTPYFESTYVDEDLRVGRTGNGDVFVSIRA